MSMSGIYKITNIITGKIYIGSAKDVPHRWRIHRSDLGLQKHGSITLQRSWNLHGEENFKFKFIEHVLNFKDLISREQYWLDLLKPYDPNIGYNILKIAGSRLGTKHTQEFKDAQSARYKGIKRSPEAVAKTAAANTGKKRTPEQCAKLSAWQKGQIRPNYHSEESKRKIGEGSKITRAKEKEKRYAEFDNMIISVIEIGKL